MTQTTEKKGVLRTFWEGFKEGWNSNTAQETPPSTPVDEVITAADEWDVDELPETAGAAESIDVADEWDMPEPMMTTAEPPQEKRGLTAFFEGFKDGWNNPPAYETNSNNKTDELHTSVWDEPPVLSPYDSRIYTDPLNVMVANSEFADDGII